MIKLVMTDLDDTLVHSSDGGDGRLTPRAIAAVQAVKDAGLLIGPASGRPRASMAHTCRGDENLFNAGAFSNGQEGWIRGERVFSVTLDGALVRDLALWLDEQGWGVPVLIDEGARHSLVTRRHDTVGPGHFDLGFLDPDDVPQQVVMVFVHLTSPLEELGQHIDELRAAFPALDFVSSNPGFNGVDVLPKGWSKARGIERLASIAGVAPDEVLVFGDGLNDLEMIQTFPNSVAVANAVPEVRAAARYAIGPAADDAVAQALEQLALGQNPSGSVSWRP